ncbi:hypothetical protein K9N68_34725 (plasmid) [Kovacikia minuta CCNUW1]|uniref:hypothetical protein n=1 Tax=Kovacikia minuta TaxID=2931930 RepID=UPI001CCC77E6|nr:hypothetical protein [Kovacikia minuta]UBF30362.1 hypothetical protein K9N68_34725 [Kovacikia minuta CCNUW1]
MNFLEYLIKLLWKARKPQNSEQSIMELLQQEPSEILLGEDSVKLTIQENTKIKWLLRLVGLWAVLGVTIATILLVAGIWFWIVGLILGIAVGMIGMTLASWAVSQTCQIDRSIRSLTLTQTGLFGRMKINRYDLDQIEKVELTPKTSRKAWSYYITLKLKTEQSVAIDLTSSEMVDRELVRRIDRFLYARVDIAVPN